MENLNSLYLEKNKYEQQLYDQGYQHIVGVDEVGRGPLAGNVTIGAVILDPERPIYGLRDSKQLTASKIATLAAEIKEKSLAYVIVSATPQTIDKIGIGNAVKKCMRRAVHKLAITPDYVLIDYQAIKFRKIPSMAITKGDDKSNSIAAASIIAKHHRDQEMIKLGKKYPNYGFEKHVGYGTKQHRLAIEEYGPIVGVHRYSFKPIRKD